PNGCGCRSPRGHAPGTPEGLAGGDLLLSFTRKRRVLYAALLLFTVWPLVHMYLVIHFDMSAWKLAGWGMYATPRPSFAGIAVMGRRNGHQDFEEIRSVSPTWQAQASEFLEWHRWLGRLSRPNGLARSFKR